MWSWDTCSRDATSIKDLCLTSHWPGPKVSVEFSHILVSSSITNYSKAWIINLLWSNFTKMSLTEWHQQFLTLSREYEFNAANAALCEQQGDHGNFLTVSNAGLLNKSSCLARALGVTKGMFVEQKLPLSCSFRCHQIYESHFYEFRLTLLCYLSRT